MLPTGTSAICNEFSQQYPNVSVNFRKLSRPSLLKLMEHYKARAHPQMTDAQLANTVARIFEAVRVPEVDIIDEFASKYCQSTADLSHPLKRQRTDVSSHCQHPASIGEQVMVNHPNLSQVTIVAQVAARISRSDEWILANVVSCDTSSQQYEVHDEDDSKKIVKLPFTFVRRLEDNASDIRRGDVVHCVFPDTTSFYRAVVVKSPKVPGQGQPWEVVVRFDDDEDETGKAPPRRVPARFVMRESAFKK